MTIQDRVRDHLRQRGFVAPEKEISWITRKLSRKTPFGNKETQVFMASQTLIEQGYAIPKFRD